MTETWHAAGGGGGWLDMHGRQVQNKHLHDVADQGLCSMGA